MMLTTVNSNAIHAIGYDPQNRQLEVIFTGGGIYLFENVPHDVFVQFLRSPSKGSFFRRRIQGRFRQERLGRLTKRQQERRAAKHPPIPETDGAIGQPAAPPNPATAASPLPRLAARTVPMAA
ncbi:MAG: KTSC domain-containing protein [Chlorobi bacterium CHB2]|nr:KTSC domain-containing protein [Chlorobi bacterium CHB2]